MPWWNWRELPLPENVPVWLLPMRFELFALLRPGLPRVPTVERVLLCD